MAIPDYQTLMLPLLKFLSDNKEKSIGDAVEYLSSEFRLTEQEKQELLPSGAHPVINNRIGWAK
jgi:restriction system protein